MNSSDFRSDARKALEGKWGKAALITLAYFVIMFAIGFVEGLISGNSDSLNSLFSIVNAIIEIPLAFGLVISFFRLYKGEDVKAFDFCNSGFGDGNFKKSWAITWQIALKMILPIIAIIVIAILFFVTIGGAIFAYNSSSAVATGAVSGFAIVLFILYIATYVWAFVKSYYYQLSYIIAADNPELSAKEAVEKSQELMTNNRAKLFWLQFSFIGWAILAACTLGIGFLWLAPYIQFATIAFYFFVSGNKVEAKSDDE